MNRGEILLKKAFTLIELLIVVAIIAILAAIAVPNFLEAQVRAKVSRAKTDMRSLSTGLESYYVDNNSYPWCNSFGIAVNSTAPDVGGTQNWSVLENITTPVAYITSIFSDAFVATKRTGSVYTGTDPEPGLGGAYSDQPKIPFYKLYLYFSTSRADRHFQNLEATNGKGIAYGCQSAGPDLISINMGGVLANQSDISISPTATPAYCANLFYDSTNGTVSFGELFRVGGQTGGGYASTFYQFAGIGR